MHKYNLIMYSFAEENYLKTIYKLSEKNDGAVSTNAIAEEMLTKAPSVTDMLKKLAQKNLVEHEKYQGVELTKSGKKTALEIVRKHRLWEMFLVETLHFKWDEVHDIAEQLEHIQSEKLVNELDAFLGFPKTDPHGDLIPDAQGRMPNIMSIQLTELNSNDTATMVGVSNHSSEFLNYLDKITITLGSKIKIIEKIAFDGSLKIQIDQKNDLFISKEVAKNLLVIKR